MRYEILGSLRVGDADGWRSITAPKVEILLATLLIKAGHVVSIDQLITEIWGGNAPRRATAALHVYVCQLRKFLAGKENPNSQVITRSPGYMLCLGEDTVDFMSFDGLIAEGRTHMRGNRPDQALVKFEAALKMWRGPLVAELRNGPVVNGFASWSDEMHLEAIEMAISCYLAFGRHREVIGRLHQLVTDHPLHEAFYHLLMTALFRAQRRADALRVYHTARNVLMRELVLQG